MGVEAVISGYLYCIIVVVICFYFLSLAFVSFDAFKDGVISFFFCNLLMQNSINILNMKKKIWIVWLEISLQQTPLSAIDAAYRLIHEISVEGEISPCDMHLSPSSMIETENNDGRERL